MSFSGMLWESELQLYNLLLSRALQFVWQELRKNFFEFEATVEYYTKLRMQIDLSLDLGWSMWSNIFSRWSKDRMINNYILLGLSFSSNPVIHAE